MLGLVQGLVCPVQGAFYAVGRQVYGGHTNADREAQLLCGAGIYPRGGNGGAQAILDAECLSGLLTEHEDPIAALRMFEAERLEVVNRIVLTNRDQPPDYIIETVDNLTGGAPFERIEDVIDPAELAAISDRYKDIARYSKEAACGR